jgi:hypothetical protein
MQSQKKITQKQNWRQSGFVNSIIPETIEGELRVDGEFCCHSLRRSQISKEL